MEDKLNKLTAEEQETLKQLIAKMNDEVAETDEPENGDIYYYISSFGAYYDAIWSDHSINSERYTIGNVFKTREEAEFEIEKLKVLAEMKRIANKDKQPEWDKCNSHFYIYYSTEIEEICIYDYLHNITNLIYFATEERARECIETVGEGRIKKYYCGVNE